MITIGGENIVDIIQTGTSASGVNFHAVNGGAPFNVAKAVGKLGVASGYLTPLSTDRFGPLFEAALKESGAKPLMPPSNALSALAIVTLDNEGVPAYAFYRETTADRDIDRAKLDASFPDNTDILYVGGLALTNTPDADEWARFLAEKKAKGTVTAVDPNIRPGFIHDRETYIKRLDNVLSNADIIKLSDEDIEWLAPKRDVDEVAKDIIARHNTPLFILTRGAEGATAYFNHQSVTVPSFTNIKIADTVGAGDCFMAATLVKSHEIGLENLTPDTVKAMLTFAAATAAINCERAGCQPPTADEVATFIKTHS